MILDCVHPEVLQVPGRLPLTDQGRVQVTVQVTVESTRQTIEKSIQTGRQKWDEVGRFSHCTVHTIVNLKPKFKVPKIDNFHCKIGLDLELD